MEQSIPLEQQKVYIAPSGYKVMMEKHPCAPSWRLVGLSGEGTVCHKPCTVSGGGKSEISKSLRDYMLGGPIFVAILNRTLHNSKQFSNGDYPIAGILMQGKARLLATIEPQGFRSGTIFGSVIKLLTPSDEYTKEYNDWLKNIPSICMRWHLSSSDFANLNGMGIGRSISPSMLLTG